MEKVQAATIEQSKVLATTVEREEGIQVSKLTINYTYWHADGYTNYYKQGVQSTTLYSERSALALQTIVDEGFVAFQAQSLAKSAVPVVP